MGRGISRITDEIMLFQGVVLYVDSQKDLSSGSGCRSVEV